MIGSRVAGQMVVNDFDFVGISEPPRKTDSPLIVNPDAYVARNDRLAAPRADSPEEKCQIPQLPRGVNHLELSQCDPFDSFKPAGRNASEKTLGLPVAKRLDHDAERITCYVIRQ